MGYQSNISEIVKLKLQQLEKIANPDIIMRDVVAGVLPELKARVHQRGQATDGSQIGTYTPSYMDVRTGNYQNADRTKKGKNAGKLKNAGTFQKGDKAGAARPKNNRTADPKVILSLTRQQENDLGIEPTPTGYGIGYKNEENYNKSQWEEATYNKRIWGLTQSERDLAISIAKESANQTMSNR